MRAHVVTEGPIEQAIMKRLMQVHPLLRRRRIRIVEGGNAASRGRTILVLHHEPVAVIMDTKSIEPRAIAELRYHVEWILGAGGAREEWESILVTPEVPVLLFQDEEVLKEVLPNAPSFEQRIVARYEPTRVLHEIFAQAGKPFPQALIRRISRTNLAALWKLEVLHPLERFLLGEQPPQHPGNPP